MVTDFTTAVLYIAVGHPLCRVYWFQLQLVLSFFLFLFVCSFLVDRNLSLFLQKNLDPLKDAKEKVRWAEAHFWDLRTSFIFLNRVRTNHLARRNLRVSLTSRAAVRTCGSQSLGWYPGFNEVSSSIFDTGVSSLEFTPHSFRINNIKLYLGLRGTDEYILGSLQNIGKLPQKVFFFPLTPCYTLVWIFSPYKTTGQFYWCKVCMILYSTMLIFKTLLQYTSIPHLSHMSNQEGGMGAITRLSDLSWFFLYDFLVCHCSNKAYSFINPRKSPVERKILYFPVHLCCVEHSCSTIRKQMR